MYNCVMSHYTDEVKRVCKTYHERIGQLEDQKFDLEYVVKRKDMEVVRRAAMEQLSFHELTKLLNLIILHLHDV